MTTKILPNIMLAIAKNSISEKELSKLERTYGFVFSNYSEHKTICKNTVALWYDSKHRYAAENAKIIAPKLFCYNIDKYTTLKKLVHVTFDIDINYIVVNSAKTWIEFCNWFNNLDIVAIDIETYGLNPNNKDSAILSIAFSDGKISYVYPFSEEFSNMDIEYDTSVHYHSLVKMMKYKLYIAHNAKFEYIWLKSIGITINICDDTMLMQAVLDQTKRRGLDDLVIEYLPEFSGYWFLTAKITDYRSLPFEYLMKYNCIDAYVTFKLASILLTMFNDDTLYRYYRDYIITLVSVLGNIELNGYLIDIDYLQKIQKTLIDSIQIIEQTLLHDYSIAINYDSPQQLGNLLYKDLGLSIIKKTTSGNASTDKHTLPKLLDIATNKKQRYIINQILERQKYETILSTFVNQYLDFCRENKFGNMLHTNYIIGGTSSFRLASSKPNLQNIPRSEKLESNNILPLKRAFIAKPFSYIVHIDYSQIELRILAMYSNEKFLIDAYENDEDIHSKTAIRIFGNNYTKEQRTLAKTVNFSIIYGATEKGLSEQIKTIYTDFDDTECLNYAEKLYGDIWELYPNVQIFFDEYWKSALKYGIVENFSGLSRNVSNEIRNAESPYMLGHIKNSICNYPIQSSAAEICLHGLINLQNLIDKYKLNWQILGTVYDSIDISISANDLSEMMINDELQTILEKLLIDDMYKKLSWLSLPLKIDIEYGKNLNDLDKLSNYLPF
jgi:DNA polymerase I